MLGEISQTEKDWHYFFTYVLNLKNQTNKWKLQNQNRLTDVEIKLVITS